MSDWVEIFRAGAYPQGTWTDRDLDRVVASYDPRYHEAPLTVGHPADDAPVFGLVRELKRAGGTLLARFRDLAPAVKDNLQRLRKFSVSLYRDLDGRGPYLRHVGMVVIPQVKGLNANAPVFREGDFEEIIPADFYEVAAADAPWDGAPARWPDGGAYARACAFVRGMSDPHRGKVPDGLTKAECWLPHHDPDQTLVPAGVSHAMAALNGARGSGPNLTAEEKRKAYDHLAAHYKNDLKAEAPAANFDDNDQPLPQGGTAAMTPEEIAKMQADLTRAKEDLAKANADLAEFQKAAPTAADASKAAKDLAEFRDKATKAEAELAKVQAAARRAETNAFLEKGVADGKILPAWLDMGLAEFLEALPDDDKAAAVTFAESGKGSEKTTPRKWAEKFLATLPTIVNFAQEATKQRAAATRQGANGASDEFEEEGHAIAATLAPKQGGK